MEKIIGAQHMCMKNELMNFEKNGQWIWIKWKSVETSLTNVNFCDNWTYGNFNCVVIGKLFV